MKIEKMWAPLLAGVGALNWGLVEFVGFNAVEFLSFGVPAIGMVLYGLVAVAGGFTLYQLFK
jgi:uncharacterized membrane protein YuzA (DUF378 family)